MIDTLIGLGRIDVLVYSFVFVSVLLFTLVAGNIVTGAVDLRRRTYPAGKPQQADADRVTSLVGPTRTGLRAQLLSSLLPTDEASKSELRKFLNLAGYESRTAPIIYQVTRLISGLSLGFVTAVSYGRLFPNAPFFVTVSVSVLMTALGFYLPKTIVSFRRDKLCNEHRNGFPDFLDLMLICADAGVGIASSIDRVSKDLVVSHPSLARNLQLMNLELRAGRSLRDALDNLGERLGIDEAKSFATLLQQSEELGTSLTQSLRVYSDEMRDKRYARAEEKAHGLPAKLVIPLGFCVFPVILAVTLLPVMIKLYKALGI